MSTPPKVIPQPMQPEPTKHQKWSVTNEQIAQLLSNSKRRMSALRGEHTDAIASLADQENKGMSQFIMQMQQEIQYLQNQVDSLEKTAKKGKKEEPPKADPKNPPK